MLTKKFIRLLTGPVARIVFIKVTCSVSSLGVTNSGLMTFFVVVVEEGHKRPDCWSVPHILRDAQEGRRCFVILRQSAGLALQIHLDVWQSVVDVRIEHFLAHPEDVLISGGVLHLTQQILVALLLGIVDDTAYNSSYLLKSVGSSVSLLTSHGVADQIGQDAVEDLARGLSEVVGPTCRQTNQ